MDPSEPEARSRQPIPTGRISIDSSFSASASVSRLAFVSSGSNCGSRASSTTGRLEAVTSTVDSVATKHTYGYVPNSALVQTLTQLRTGGTTVTTTKGYDRLGRLSSTSTSNSNSPSVSAAYLYNDANQRTRLTREDTTAWNFDYDALGQVITGQKRLADGTGALGFDFAYTYDDIGNRKTATANGQSSTYTPTLLNTYSQRTVPGTLEVFGTAAADATVTITSAGIISSPTRQGETFLYELAGNNTSAAQYPAFKLTGVKNGAGANGEDAVTSITKQAFVPKTPEVFTYDTDGNLTQDGRWIYTWDAENRLVTMETQAAAAKVMPAYRLDFSYDSQGRRIAKTVSIFVVGSTTPTLLSDTRFLYDGWNLIAELSVNLSTFALSPLRTYVWGLDLSGTAQGAGGVGGLLSVDLKLPTSTSSAGTFLPAYDGNGNILAYCDATTGARSATFEYGPFGEPLRATYATPQVLQSLGVGGFRFSTKYEDAETGHLYYGFRYYNPSTGRFINRDPLEELSFPVIYNTQLESAHSLSSQSRIGEEPVFLELRRSGAEYVMLNNSPLNAIEYLGLEPFKEKHCNVLNETCTDSRRVRSPDGKGYFSRCIRFVCTYQCFCPGDDQCSKFPCEDHKGGTCPFAHGVHVGPIYSTPKDTPLWARILGGGAEFAPNCHQSPIKEKAYTKFKCRGEL